MTTLLVVIALLAAINLVVLRWGVDSRRSGGEWGPLVSPRQMTTR